MKRSFTCFILLIYFQFVCAQTGIITYKAQSLMQSETNKEHSNSLKTEVDLMLFTLKYNGSYSFFKKEKNIPINRFQSALATILIKSNIAWYQEIKKSESKFENEIKGESYQVINNDYFNNWKLLDQVKVIDSYACYKAEKKVFNSRSGKYSYVEAWYTPDIPVPYGPIGSGGLPGLILQFKIPNRVIYTANKIVLNSKRD